MNFASTLSIAQSVLSKTPTESIYSTGKVTGIKGQLILAKIPAATIGTICTIQRRDGLSIQSQVVSFSESAVTLAPFEEVNSISVGDPVYCSGRPFQLRISRNPTGNIFDALGKNISRELTSDENQIVIKSGSSAPHIFERVPITQIFHTGIRSIDGFCTIGVGQRIGLFAAAGVGKSTLLGMIAKKSHCDLCIIALIGERGREVSEFIEDMLGPDGLKKSIVVAATSNETPMRRVLAAETAMSLAEYYRSKGRHVLLLFDSLTRYARALRDISLAAGELPIRQGFPVTVFSSLPKLLERAGSTKSGSITGMYTMLTNDEDDVDPLADEVKGLLDGHICLSSSFSKRRIQPSVNILNSVSRLNLKLNSKTIIEAQNTFKKMLHKILHDKDLLIFGGTPDVELQYALNKEDELLEFLSQDISVSTELSCTQQMLLDITTTHN